jgi:hypothetical protein
MGQISGGLGATLRATIIYDLDSYYDGANVWLLAATDVDTFIIKDDREPTTVWTDLQLSETLGGEYSDYATPAVGVAVYKAMFAADYKNSGVIWSVYYDEYASTALDDRFPALAGNTGGYGIIARNPGSTLWGTVITPVIVQDTVGATLANVNCDLEFAASYSSISAPELYAALSFAGNTTCDDIYRIECGFYGAAGSVTQFDVDPDDRVDFCSLEVKGNVIIAGTQDTNPGGAAPSEVWFSTNGGTSWSMASKNPTGLLVNTCNILISEYGATNGLAFAATGGTQSAVSISEDDGNTWTQIAFIDDDITTVDDIAFNSNNKAALLITTNAGGKSSLWKVADVTALVPSWQRTLCEDFSTTTINEFTMVEYSDDGVSIMLYDSADNRIYRSTDDTSTFTNWRNTASWGLINEWLVPNSSTVYAATATGFWSTSLVGSRIAGVNLVSIAGSGDALAVGSDAGTIYISFNKGGVFGTAFAVPGVTTSDDVYVAFDANFGVSGAVGTDLLYTASENGVVYQCQLVNDAADADKVFMGTPTVTTLTGVVKDNDGLGATSGAVSYNAIIVADDNALYLAGEIPTGTSSVPAAANVSGTIQIADDVGATGFGQLTIASTTISGAVGNFVNGEVLLVIGDNLVVDAGGTTVSGTVQLRGVTSGATGYITLTAAAIGSLVGTWTATDTVSITSSNLLCATAGGSSSATTGIGMQRLLLHERGNVWESEANTGMAGLWYTNGSNILWTIVSGTGIDVFEDFLSGKVQGVTATEFMPNPNNFTKSVTLTWTQVKQSALVYEIEIWNANTAVPVYEDTVYYTVPAAKLATGTTLSTVITGLSHSTKYTFYVRVYEQQMNQSRWSTGVSLTTSAYLPAPMPISPIQGQPQAATTSLNPTFTWSSVSTAVSYDFQLSNVNTFTTLIDTVNLNVNGYTYTGDGLDYDKDYYWRVRSVANDGSKSEWSTYCIIDSFGYYSSTGAPTTFHTMMDPDLYADEFTVTQTVPTIVVTQTQTNPTYTIPVPEFTVTVPVAVSSTVTTQTHTITIPDEKTPVYIWAIVAIGALLTIAVIILIIRTRRVV